LIPDPAILLRNESDRGLLLVNPPESGNGWDRSRNVACSKIHSATVAMCPIRDVRGYRMVGLFSKASTAMARGRRMNLKSAAGAAARQRTGLHDDEVTAKKRKLAEESMADPTSQAVRAGKAGIGHQDFSFMQRMPADEASYSHRTLIRHPVARKNVTRTSSARVRDRARSVGSALVSLTYRWASR
jgi:hypothetical protein